MPATVLDSLMWSARRQAGWKQHPAAERGRLVKKIAQIGSLNDLDGIWHGISCSLRLPLA
jgi:hypothetical protein